MYISNSVIEAASISLAVAVHYKRSGSQEQADLAFLQGACNGRVSRINGHKVYCLRSMLRSLMASCENRARLQRGNLQSIPSHLSSTEDARARCEQPAT